MSVMQSKDNEMPVFIQALYGVILGVGFLQGKDILQEQLDLDSLFKFLFFLFSMFIVAHDWYIYHSVPVKRPEKFWYYSLQIGSMFFLSQMVIVSADMSIGYGTADWWRSVNDSSQAAGFKKGDWSLQPEIAGKGFWALLKIPVVQWYVFGVFYTVCNFFNLFFLSQAKELQKTSIIHYILHLAICITAFHVLFVFDFSNAACLWVLGGTIFLVIALWQRREEIANTETAALNSSLKQKLKAKIRIRFSGGRDDLKSLNGISLIQELPDDKTEAALKKIEIVKAFLEAEKDNKPELKQNNPGHDVFIESLNKNETADNYRKALGDLFV